MALGTKNLWARKGDKEDDKEHKQKRKRNPGEQIEAHR